MFVANQGGSVYAGMADRIVEKIFQSGSLSSGITGSLSSRMGGSVWSGIGGSVYTSIVKRVNHQQPRYRVAIVGDGQTERIYFDNIRDTDRPANLAIFPDSPKKFGSYKGVLERAELLVEDYDRVYALIDYDKVIHDNQQQAYAAAKKKIESTGVIVLENNPCFELWLLLHFIYTTRLFSDCDEVSELLKSHIPNYSKSEKFLVKVELYKKYKDRISTHAIPNAKRLEANRAGQDQLFPRAQTFEFFEWYFANT